MSEDGSMMILEHEQKQYVDHLIKKSDLMVTDEEKGLFPGLSREATEIYMTELKLENDAEKLEKSISDVNIPEIQVTKDNEQSKPATPQDLLVKEDSIHKDSSSPINSPDELMEQSEMENTKSDAINDESEDEGHHTTNIEKSADFVNDEEHDVSTVDKDEHVEDVKNDEVDDEDNDDDETKWDTDLEEESEKLVSYQDHTSRSRYLDMCDKLDIVPATYYLTNIDKPRLSMKHHGLGPMGTKALAKSLESNITLTVLDLSGNGIQIIGAMAVAKLLDENNYITTLNLAENMIGDAGIKHLCKSASGNVGLKQLDISGNSIGDDSAAELSDFVEKNKCLLSLNLSRNDIGSKCAYLLGAAIASNDIMEELDISWNKINGQGAYAIARGLKENVRIKRCNLSFNGFAKEGGQAIAEMLKDHGYLQSLNIESNRFDEDIAILIGRSLALNETLLELYMGLNPINTNGILSLISALDGASEMSNLELLSIKDIPVDFEIVKTIEHLRMKRPEFRCIHGLEIGVGNTEEDKTKRMINTKNPIVLLKEHIIIKDKRLIDILDQIDEEKSRYVTIEQFGLALEQLGVPFKKSQLEDVRSRLDKQGNGTIYYGDFLATRPKTAEPPTTEPPSEIDFEIEMGAD